VRTETPKYSRGPGSIDAALGLKIRSRRLAVRLSQKSLGAQLGVTTLQIHNYEHGLAKMTAGRVVEIAQALGCPVTDFVDEFDKLHQPTGVPVAAQSVSAEASQLLHAYAGLPRALRRTTLELLVAIAEDQADRRQD
jgi:transcriptional regulator with XRE-family HTH domain